MHTSRQQDPGHTDDIQKFFQGVGLDCDPPMEPGCEGCAGVAPGVCARKHLQPTAWPYGRTYGGAVTWLGTKHSSVGVAVEWSPRVLNPATPVYSPGFTLRGQGLYPACGRATPQRQPAPLGNLGISKKALQKLYTRIISTT